MDDIISLLNDYRDYQNQTTTSDFAGFGEWLKQKYSSTSEYETDEPEVNEAGPEVMATYVLAGLSNYIDVWIKLTYQDLPILSLGDFGIIKTVEYYGNPTKKMVSDDAIMEHSTCIESIKRLIKKGILSETVDSEDKRIRRVSLTKEGEELSQLLNQRMIALGKFMMGDVNELEMKALIPTLNKLLAYHDRMYKRENRQSIKKEYGL